MTETDMSVRLPDNVYIARGAHSPGDPAAGDPACTMEWASWLAGEEEWSDHPECTHPVLAAGVHAVNDGLDDGPRQRLAELIPELIDTADHRDDLLARHQLSVRLAAWAAEQVAHLIPHADRAVCMRAIEAARAWADAPTGEARAVARAAAMDADRAADVAGFYATYAADVAGFYAAMAAIYAARAAAIYASAAAGDAIYAAATAAVVALPADDAIGLLRDLVAEHARLTKQEG